MEFLICKFTVLRFNNQFNYSDLIAKMAAKLGALSASQVPADRQIVLAKARYAINEQSHTKGKLDAMTSLENLLWVLDQFQQNSLHLLAKNTAEMILKHMKPAREISQKVIEAGIRSSSSLGTEEARHYFENQLETLKNKSRILLLNSLAIDPDRDREACSTATFNKNMREVVIGAVNESKRNVILHTDNYSLEALEQAVAANKNLRLLVVDTPICWNKKNRPFRAEEQASDRLSEASSSEEAHAEPLWKTKSEHSPLQQARGKYILQNPTMVVLVLGSSQDPQLEAALDRYALPHLCWVDLSKKMENRLDVLNLWLVREFKYAFLAAFARLFFDCESGDLVQDALAEAQRAVAAMLEPCRLLRTDLLLAKQAGDPHLRVDPAAYFGDVVRAAPKRLEAFEVCIKQGYPEETPSVFCNPSIIKMNELTLAREEFIGKLLSSVKNYQVINVYGYQDIGQSTFMKHLTNQLYFRGLFRDGILMIDLNKEAAKSKTRSIKELIQAKLGQTPTEDLHAFFKGKDLLIIFDNFHVVTDLQLIIFPVHLIKTLQEHKIKMLLTSVKALQIEDYIKSSLKLRVDKMNAAECLHTTLLNLMNKKSVGLQYHKEAFQKLLACDYIKRFKLQQKKNLMNPDEFLEKSLGYLQRARAEDSFSMSEKQLGEDNLSLPSREEDSEERGLHLLSEQGSLNLGQPPAASLRRPARRKTLKKISRRLLNLQAFYHQ